MKGKAALIVLFASFVLYILDIISDIYVAIQYYRNGEYWWCGMTLAFVVIPHLIINTYAAYINIKFLWLTRRNAYLMWIFQISMLASFKQEFIRWKREHWKCNRKNAEDEQHSADVTLTMHHTFLCLTEAFAESAPQWCLQNYIMIRQWYFPWYTVLSTVLSLLSLAWSVTSMETSCKTCRWAKNKVNQTFPKHSLVVFFAAHLCLLISRLSSIVIFAYVFRYHVLYVVGIHWLLVFTGICLGKKLNWIIFGNETDISVTLILINASVRAYPMVFFLSSSILKISFRKKISENFKAFVFIFYGILFVENSVMALLSICKQSTQVLHISFLAYILLPLVFGGFIFGALFLFLYYHCCHPALVVRDVIVESNSVEPVEDNTTGL